MVKKIKIFCIGKIKENYIKEGITEFLKRLKKFCDVEIVEFKDEGLNKESLKVSKLIDNNSFLLDPDGKEFDSVNFASELKKYDNLNFFIGGHDGFDNKLKQDCDLISLSKMTFTHEMARLFLIEQIYRGFMINNNRKYHR
ncbi:23S rRNA (pseudouridine(1915)-N(3))-methyltransferase RlmH [Candidatus Woesearchaeota archaeon]|nr:MAG: 23S rRNA (pseudouridine(1915)-N(3))-methyltransferase RlmH [Candidatus Woesearchaeota archaeon]